MKPWEVVATATAPDGTLFELQRHDQDYVIHADGRDVMSSSIPRNEWEGVVDEVFALEPLQVVWRPCFSR